MLFYFVLSNKGSLGEHKKNAINNIKTSYELLNISVY